MFLESIQSEERSHTSEFLAADLTSSRAINVIEGKVTGVVMNNTSANQKALRILKGQHPCLFFQSCVAHGSHLLVKDVFAASKTKQNQLAVPEFPEGYPFEQLLKSFCDCKKVAKFLHNHNGPKS